MWSKFDPQTSEYQRLLKQNELIPNTNWLDPYNPAAQATFYNFSNVSGVQHEAGLAVHCCVACFARLLTCTRAGHHVQHRQDGRRRRSVRLRPGG